jgi:hypothetical protein
VSIPPWLVLALVLTLALALAYQLARRHYGWRVMFYWVLILAGFLGTEAAAESLGWNFTRLGDLRLLPDVAGAVIIIGVLWVTGA